MNSQSSYVALTSCNLQPPRHTCAHMIVEAILYEKNKLAPAEKVFESRSCCETILPELLFACMLVLFVARVVLCHLRGLGCNLSWLADGCAPGSTMNH